MGHLYKNLQANADRMKSECFHVFYKSAMFASDLTIQLVCQYPPFSTDVNLKTESFHFIFRLLRSFKYAQYRHFALRCVALRDVALPCADYNKPIFMT